MTIENLPALLNISEENAPAIYTGKGLDKFFEQIKASVNEVPDVSTKKGRDRIASLAYKVSQSKSAVEKPGRDYLRVVKELPKKIEAELREFVQQCDELRDEVRKPLTEWEAKQARIEAEKKAAEEAAALAKQIESDWEIAILMDREFDRKKEEERKEAERLQKEHEERIAREAAEKARLEAEAKAQAEREAAARREAEAKLAAEAKAQAEREAAARREAEAKLAAERAEREKLEAQQRAIEAEARARLEKEAAEKRAEQARIDAIEQERKRVEAENAAIEADRLRREKDKAHKSKINNESLDDLVALGLSTDQAKAVIVAIAKGGVRNISIHY